MKALGMLPVLVVIALGLSGCGSLSQGTRDPSSLVLQRKMNTWQSCVARPVDQTYRAVLAGLTDLGIRPQSNQVDQVSGSVRGTFADGMPFTIILSAEGLGITRISVRCGTLGDKERTQFLFDAFRKHL